jgi:hypothetical protein
MSVVALQPECLGPGRLCGSRWDSILETVCPGATAASVHLWQDRNAVFAGRNGRSKLDPPFRPGLVRQGLPRVEAFDGIHGPHRCFPETRRARGTRWFQVGAAYFPEITGPTPTALRALGRPPFGRSRFLDGLKTSKSLLTVNTLTPSACRCGPSSTPSRRTGTRRRAFAHRPVSH